MFAIFFLANFVSVLAGDFLESRESDQLQQSDIQDSLMDELYNAGENPEVQLILRQVQPTYDALPKNKYGRLDPATVRYAVHRYFVQRYGWYVSGLDPAGSTRNGTVSEGIMKERAPAFVEQLFDDILGERGFGLQDLAVFAAIVADLIHKEAAARLNEIHDAFEFGKEMTHQRLELAVKVYLAEFLLGMKVRSMKAVKIVDDSMWQAYPDWDNTMMWAKDMRSDFMWRGRDTRNPFVEHRPSFEQNAAFLYNMTERYNSYQNLECQRLKSSLVEMEHEGTGRVRLNRFYSGGTGGDWKFTENVDFLRNLGALDESNSDIPTVVIPNYLLSRTNCMSSSKFYAVCCVDECEPLMLELETKLARPSATPATLVSVVSALESDTVAAPRNLSAVLVSRLDAIAEMHGGLVPLHGRLFAQWLHHAYPRECPFPHVSGTIKPITPDEWLAEFGTLEATRREMRIHNRTKYKKVPVEGEAADSLPWTMVEELVAAHSDESKQESWLWSALRPAMAVVAMVSFVAPLVRACKGFSAKTDSKSERVLV